MVGRRKITAAFLDPSTKTARKRAAEIRGSHRMGRGDDLMPCATLLTPSTTTTFAGRRSPVPLKTTRGPLKSNMAAAVSPRPSSGFDIRTTAPYPIRLDLSTYSSVQFNHKPELADPERADVSINTASNGNKVSLSLKDGSERYKYEGRRHKDSNTYVLVLDQEGKEFALEKVDSSYALNLTRAPWETDSTVLQESHPQLVTAFDDEDDMLVDDDDGGVSLSAEADADNPFDFRHYLDAPASPSPQMQPTKVASAVTPTVSQTSTRTNTPLTKSTRKQPTAFAPKAPPKPKAKPKPVQKPVPKQPEPTASTRSPSPPPQRRKKEDVDVPSVRLDRRASTRIALPPKPPPKKRDIEDLSLDNGDDAGDLILEGFEPSRSSYNNKSSLGLGLSDLGAGPRSLRSAASSPAGSHINSPAQRLESPMDDDEQSEDEDVEMDDGYGQQEEDESDVDEDHDVAALQLPSPARVHRPSIGGHPATDDADELSLEEQMRLVLEGGLEEDAPRQAESDEESEEE